MHCLYNKIMNSCTHVFYHQIKGGASDNVITEEGMAGLDLLISRSVDKRECVLHCHWQPWNLKCVILVVLR